MGRKKPIPCRGWEGRRALASGVENFFLSFQPPPSRRQAPIPCRGGRQKGVPLQMCVQKWFQSGLNGIYFPRQLTDWLLVEVALLLIGLTGPPYCQLPTIYIFSASYTELLKAGSPDISVTVPHGLNYRVHIYFFFASQ